MGTIPTKINSVNLKLNDQSKKVASKNVSTKIKFENINYEEYTKNVNESKEEIKNFLEEFHIFDNPNTIADTNAETTNEPVSVVGDVENNTPAPASGDAGTSGGQGKPKPTTNTKTEKIDPSLAKNVDEKLGDGFCAKVEEVSKRINCDPNDLLVLMYSECGFKPSAVESSTGAVGLIQFMPSTAKSLGYTTSEIKNMSAIEQLDVVEKYINSADYYSKGEYKDAADLYSICFLPGRANRDVLTTRGESYYKYNSAFDTNKDGQITKAEMAARLDKKRVEMEKYY